MTKTKKAPSQKLHAKPAPKKAGPKKNKTMPKATKAELEKKLKEMQNKLEFCKQCNDWFPKGIHKCEETPKEEMDIDEGGCCGTDAHICVTQLGSYTAGRHDNETANGQIPNTGWLR